MDVIEFFEGFKTEHFQSKKYNSKLDILDFDNNMLLYFDIEDDTSNNYIPSNYQQLCDKFKQIEISFLYLPKIQKETQKIEAVFNYYLPYLNEYPFDNFNQLLSSNPFYLRALLEDFGYNGSIKVGFIFKKHSNFYVIESQDIDFLNLEENPIEKLFSFFKAKNNYAGQMVFESRHNSKPRDPFENLDFNTIEKIKQIEQQLQELKSQGQLLFVLPILKQIIANTANEIDLNTVSNIHIDDNYRVLLPYFNNIEITLSHLTKAVYILFHNHPNGINIKELYHYKEELKDLYLNISNQLDFDKMTKSIEDIINPNSKSIYTHISRIKSAFYSVLDKTYADNYIIDSDYFGEDVKYISIIKPTPPPISDNELQAFIDSF